MDAKMDIDMDMDAIRQIFLVETAEGLAEMESALIDLERHPAETHPLHLVFRHAHTIKGNAATLGLADVVEIAHVMEDLLEQLRSGARALTTALTTLLLRAVDALRDTIAAAVAGREGLSAEAQRLLLQLADACGGTGAAHDTDALLLPEAGALDLALSSGQAPGVRRTQSLRVDSGRLDRLLDLTSEIAIARGRLRESVEALAAGGSVEAVVTALWQTDAFHQELQEQVMKVRMVPLGPVFRQFVRTVRDVSMQQGKLTQLVLEGEDVEVDMTVVEHLRDPITHMLRNAIDHGLEHPGVRQERGKPAIGTITVSARHERGSVVIEIADDGAGLSRDRLLARARKQGLVAEGEQPNDADLNRLIFLPGFSTAEQVTALSGRGVGMDVVRRNVETLRGTLGVTSREGAGTTITIRLPLTLAIIQGFAVGVGAETYLVPLDTVTECLRLPAELVGTGDATGVLNLRGEVLPFVRLGRRLGRADWRARREECVLVVHDEDGCAGLVVDVLYGESQAVIKPLGRMFTGLPGVSGSTILGSGRVALILDVPSLLDEARATRRVDTPSTPVAGPEASAA